MRFGRLRLLRLPGRRLEQELFGLVPIVLNLLPEKDAGLKAFGNSGTSDFGHKIFHQLCKTQTQTKTFTYNIAWQRLAKILSGRKIEAHLIIRYAPD